MQLLTNQNFMSNKSQLNSLSKREILESLLSRQQQDSTTMNRLVLAIALAAGLDAEMVAEKFADAAATGEFAEKFNKALDAEFSKKQAQAPQPSVAPSEQVAEASLVEAGQE